MADFSVWFNLRFLKCYFVVVFKFLILTNVCICLQAAFLLPIVHILLTEPQDLVLDSEHCEPQVIIISPTRELTLQIFNEARKFSHGSVIKTVVTYGGTAAFHQAQQVMVSQIIISN